MELTDNAAGKNGKVILEFKSLSKGYGDLVALDRITAQINEGEFVSIVGPSGCGKTTLLRIIAGLETATSGEVLLNGESIQKTGQDRGFVFQSDCLLPWRNVLDNICIGLEIRNNRLSTQDVELARQFIQKVGLGGFEKYYPYQLSGGMRQRANIARAFVINPQILLMDEPFSALDAQTREIMQLELAQIWQRDRNTVLFITHQIDEAVFLSDRVIVLGRRPGQVIETISIDNPRPRDLSTKHTPRSAEYAEHIWKLIEQQVFESIAEERK